MNYFVVWRTRGPNWDDSLPMKGQRLWAEHAAFMNALTAEGFVVLGGPLGTGEEVLLVIYAENEEVIGRRLAADPWSEVGLLQVERVLPWTILLDARNP